MSGHQSIILGWRRPPLVRTVALDPRRVGRCVLPESLDGLCCGLSPIRPTPQAARGYELPRFTFANLYSFTIPTAPVGQT